MTLGTLLPDYAQRMASTKRAKRSQTLLLPTLSGLAALVGSSMAQAPDLAMYACVTAACLVSNAGVSSVGPTALLKSGLGMNTRNASIAIGLIGAVSAAAFATVSLAQIVTYASWAVGVGSILVAPAAGVVLADYWVCRDRYVDRASLADASPASAYHYAGGVNVRAVLAVLAGMVPDAIAVARNAAASLQAGESAFASYVVNSEYSSVVATSLAALTYVTLTLASVPESLKVARAEAAALNEEERLERLEAEREAAEKEATLAEAREAARRLAEQQAAARTGGDERRDAPKPLVPPTTPRKEGAETRVVDENTIVEETTTVEEVSTDDATEVITTTVIRTRERKANAFIGGALQMEKKKLGKSPKRPDVDDIDLAAVKAFYDDIAERIRMALEPARKAQAEAQAAIKALLREELAMQEEHVRMSGKISVREVRYETMRIKELIAEAELNAATVADELAEAWLFFEEEGVEDTAQIEAKLEEQRDRRLRDFSIGNQAELALAKEVYRVIDEHRVRAADAKKTAIAAQAAQKSALASKKTATAACETATEELRAEDESRSLLRNWALAVGTWRCPPVMDVPMLPMSESEMRVRAQEDQRRSDYELARRFEAEEETRRRGEEDARRALAEADLRRLIEDEDRLRAREDQRRRAAADDVERLRALVASAAETIQSTKVNITRQTQQRTQEEQVNVEREEARRVAAATEIRRVEADVKAAREQEEERRAAFDERLRGMAAEEERRREEELARIATFDAQIVELEEAELVTVREEEKTLAELVAAMDAERDALAALALEIETRREAALAALTRLGEEEARLRAEEDARRADAERAIAMAAMEERGRLMAEEDERRAAENARRADAADAAAERARKEQAIVAEEDARRAAADDAERLLTGELEDTERSIAARRAQYALDAEARKRAMQDADAAERRRRELSEAEMAAAAAAEARLRAEEEARKQAAEEALAALEAQNAALLEGRSAGAPSSRRRPSACFRRRSERWRRKKSAAKPPSPPCSAPPTRSSGSAPPRTPAARAPRRTPSARGRARRSAWRRRISAARRRTRRRRRRARRNASARGGGRAPRRRGGGRGEGGGARGGEAPRGGREARRGGRRGRGAEESRAGAPEGGGRQAPRRGGGGLRAPRD